MPGAAIGALLGFAFSGALAGAGIFSIFGMGIGTLWLVGASIGSLFDAPSLDIGGSTPNYAFGQLSNTKSQLLPVPIVYGRCRVGGNIFMQTFYDDSLQKMDMFVGVSEGPIQSIKSVYANDVVLIDENGDVVHELVESSLNLHLGAPDQVADSRDPGGNAYPNTAYIALTLKAQDGLTGNPVISSIVEGRKVWTPSGTVFTRNPAWIVYDFLTNTRYGVGIPTDLIDLDSFTDAATYCDAVMDDDGPRFTLDYIIDVQRPAIDHLQAMLGCFRGFFLARDKIELHVEQTGSVYKALGPDNFVKDSFTWWQKSGDDSPNRIVIEWIDPNNHYEQSSAPFEIQEDIIARGVFEKSISLLGVTRPEQVGRLGNYLLETARRVQNFCAFQVSLQDADIEAGEIVSITYPDFTGWSAKAFRVLKVQDEGQNGNVTITCAEYDAAVYSDDGLNVDSPVQDSPPVTYDDVYALTLEDVGHQEGDGTWVPIIRATWQNPSDYTPTAINVRWRYVADEGEPEEEWTLHTNSTRLITQTNIPSLETGREVEIWVNCVRPDTGKETTGKIASIIVGKDVEAPDAPTGLTATGWFGSIILEWINPTAPDLSHIEIWENAVDDRDSAVKIADAKGTTYMRYLGSFQGRYYWIRAVDLSGNVSAWNAEAGVYGYSDMENADDFWNALLQSNPYIQEALDNLDTPIESLAETDIFNALSDYEMKLADNAKGVFQNMSDEMAILASLSELTDVQHSIASIREERITRQTEDEALASQVLNISAMIGDPTNPGEDTVYAAINIERTARVTRDEALASEINTLSAVIGDPVNPGPNTVYAAFVHERTVRATQDQALAQNINALSATIGDPFNPAPGTVHAAIKTEQTARANADGALATSINNVVASIGNPSSPAPGTVYAAVRTEATARANADSALASNVTTLQTKVDGNTASVQQIMQSVDGIKARWGVRLDVNGRVTGLELLGGADQTAMVFKVDSFIIQTPDNPNGTPPFMLGTVNGRTQVVIKDAFIEDGSIKNAKIQDLTVGRIKLASGGPGALSWGVTSGYQWPFGGPYGFVDSSERVFRELYIDTTGATHVLVQAYMRSFIYGGN
ncbi:MAG: phage tail protein, partial [Bacilli bacterium]